MLNINVYACSSTCTKAIPLHSLNCMYHQGSMIDLRDSWYNVLKYRRLNTVKCRKTGEKEEEELYVVSEYAV